MDINTALIGVLAVVLVLNHLRQTDCREQIRAEVNEARREEANRCKANLEKAFYVWRHAAFEGRLVPAMKEEEGCNEEHF